MRLKGFGKLKTNQRNEWIKNMKAIIKVDVVPFKVPHSVEEKQPEYDPTWSGGEAPTLRRYTLDMLSENLLSDLCNEFRREVFSRAGKQDPDHQVAFSVEPGTMVNCVHWRPEKECANPKRGSTVCSMPCHLRTLKSDER